MVAGVRVVWEWRAFSWKRVAMPRHCTSEWCAWVPCSGPRRSLAMAKSPLREQFAAPANPRCGRPAFCRASAGPWRTSSTRCASAPEPHHEHPAARRRGSHASTSRGPTRRSPARCRPRGSESRSLVRPPQLVGGWVSGCISCERIGVTASSRDVRPLGEALPLRSSGAPLSSADGPRRGSATRVGRLATSGGSAHLGPLAAWPREFLSSPPRTRCSISPRSCARRRHSSVSTRLC